MDQFGNPAPDSVSILVPADHQQLVVPADPALSQPSPSPPSDELSHLSDVQGVYAILPDPTPHTEAPQSAPRKRGITPADLWTIFSRLFLTATAVLACVLLGAATVLVFNAKDNAGALLSNTNRDVSSLLSQSNSAITDLQTLIHSVRQRGKVSIDIVFADYANAPIYLPCDVPPPSPAPTPPSATPAPTPVPTNGTAH
jgi:hypothetical protein